VTAPSATTATGPESADLVLGRGARVGLGLDFPSPSDYPAPRESRLSAKFIARPNV
jgi:hypothetical protein